MILYDRRAFFKYIISNQAVKCPLNKKVGIKNCKKEVKTMEQGAIVGLFKVQNHY